MMDEELFLETRVLNYTALRRKKEQRNSIILYLLEQKEIFEEVI